MVKYGKYRKTIPRKTKGNHRGQFPHIDFGTATKSSHLTTPAGPLKLRSSNQLLLSEEYYLGKINLKAASHYKVFICISIPWDPFARKSQRTLFGQVACARVSIGPTCCRFENGPTPKVRLDYTCVTRDSSLWECQDEKNAIEPTREQAPECNSGLAGKGGGAGQAQGARGGRGRGRGGAGAGAVGGGVERGGGGGG